MARLIPDMVIGKLGAQPARLAVLACAVLLIMAVTGSCGTTRPAYGASDSAAGYSRDKAEPGSETFGKEKAAKTGSSTDAMASDMPASRAEDERTAGPAPAMAPSVAPGAAATTRKTPASESGLSASYSDDNEQFNYFVKFLDEYGPGVPHYPMAVSERIVIQATDRSGKALANAEVTVSAQDRLLCSGKTLSSGTWTFYPADLPEAGEYTVHAAFGGKEARIVASRRGPRTLQIKLDLDRSQGQGIPLDLLFVLDTTGSMGGEIERLKATIEIINANLLAVKPAPRIRFGMVLYQDVGDEFRTRLVPFTQDLGQFQAALDTVQAGGGGDTPEDLQAALEDSIKNMQWRPDGLRLAYVVTDAPPHLDYGQTYTYASAARDARAKGIKIHTIGTGGLPLAGEYVLRQISQFSGGRYIFLTYGEKGESSGGTETSVSHHTGSNYVSDKLESVIIRFTREELAFQSDAPLVQDQPWFDARKISVEERSVTLGKLFVQSLTNLSDYSTFRVGPSTRALLLPVQTPPEADAALRQQAEYFGEAILQGALEAKVFSLVDRASLLQILEEQEFQQSGLVDDAKAVKAGGLAGAEVLVLPRIFIKGERYELFFKLLRVETAEVLAVSKCLVDASLGLY